MRIDILNELQRAHPWTRDFEEQLFHDTIEQARMADRAGYEIWWLVEHHGALEFSLSSVPELFALEVARATENIRIGHSGVLSPFGINHPIRVAERSAFLDVMSGGRLEMGLARSGGSEWEHFTVDGDDTRPEMMELFTMLPKMWGDDVFSWESERIFIPPIQIAPKPLQRPRPPLWQTATSPDAFNFAGRLGVGVVGVTLMTPLETVVELKATYRAGHELADMTVEGPINNQLAMFTFVHCAESRDAAIESRAAEGVLWYVNNMSPVFKVPRSNIIGILRGNFLSGDAKLLSDDDSELSAEMDPDDPVPVIRLLNRLAMGMEVDPEEVYDTVVAEDSVIIGDPETCLKKMKKYEEVGVDRLLCFQQFGYLDQDQVMGSIERIGQELISEFHG